MVVSLSSLRGKYDWRVRRVSSVQKSRDACQTDQKTLYTTRIGSECRLPISPHPSNRKVAGYGPPPAEGGMTHPGYCPIRAAPGQAAETCVQPPDAPRILHQPPQRALYNYTCCNHKNPPRRRHDTSRSNHPSKSSNA